MIIGEVSCRDILPIIYGIGVINLLLVVVVIYFQYRLAKDNGILAGMINKILRDIPN